MFDLISRHSPQNAKNDILSGLTVALALVPEAVAFAFVAHVAPLVGLYAAFIMGLLAAPTGRSSRMPRATPSGSPDSPW
ncbi:SulP family inorganic anion transporter [Thiolapillus sp.]|uniref:SulP family inorganic anion transporter n=1 Tax=Thiolapillus sp. TaxID=2017437 RepID=UPI003AF84A02